MIDGGSSARHLVLVLPSLTMGGAEAQLVSMLEASRDELARTRVTLLTFLPPQNQAIARRFEALGLRIDLIDRSTMGFVPFFVRLVRYFRSARPAVVHTFLGGSTGTWGRLAARMAGVPYVLFSDRNLVPTMTRVQRFVDPLVRPLTTRFLPNANATAERLVRQGVPRERIVVLPNGVDAARFAPGTAPSLRPSWSVPDDATVAGFLAMLRREKRPELLLDAIARLPVSERPDYVVFAGEGVLRRALEERIAADPWMTERCILLGVVEDTPAFLASIDFLVLTSDAEGTPNAILEAMATGKPCVATRVADVPDLVGNEGFLADSGDAASIADALRRMVQLTPEARARMGMAGRRRIVAAFSMEVAARRFWAAHEDLLPAATQVADGAS